MGWRPADLERYRRFAERYLERQLRNRHLPSESRDLVPGAIEAIRRPLDPHVAADPRRAAEATVERVGAEIDRVLEPLDREARRLIRRAAVDVAVVTGVTPSVLLDGLITLARNLDLISRLADLYYGRPGLFGTLRVVRDVLGAAAAAGAAEIVSEHVTSTLAEMTGSWGARLLGPIGQATINGVLTMRLGAAARMRCRSLRARRVPWNPISRAGFRKAAQRLYAWIAEDLGPASSRTIGVWTTWLSARDADGAAAEGAAGGEDGEAGGTATAGAAAPGGVLDRLRRRWRRRREEQDGDGEDDGSAGAIEPLIDGGLLEE